jgi:DNA repair exonuclease SbcCD ATPase subunit
MGIESKAFEIGTGGALIKGKNRSGKTSIMQAFVSALTGAGIDPDHIRAGADKAEILIDFTDPVAQVRRVGRRSGNNGLETDGIGLGKQQTRLDELIGPSIRPLALLNAKPAERRKMILEAMPAEVTAADLLLWTGDKWEPDQSRHGLEVIADVRKHYYDMRTSANAAAKEAQRKHEEARAKAKALESPAHGGVLVPLPGEEDQPVRAAEEALAELNRRRSQAAEQEEKSKGTRERIAEMRARADSIESNEPPAPSVSERLSIDSEITRLNEKIGDLKEQLHIAESLLASEKEKLSSHLHRQESANSNSRNIDQLRRQAAEVETSLASVAIAPPAESEFGRAALARDQAEEHRLLVRSARAAHDALVEAAALGDDATDAEAEADRLNAIVETLTARAPAELAARSDTIKGLTFTADGGIALDGVALDLLSGQEAIDFCIRVAKRAHPKCKLLTADKLEQLDPESLEAFVKMATADGWQLIGTRVEAGEMVIELLEAA